MANRYWVGGTGSWDTSSTTNWSTASGGAGGASVPTGSDDVIFDANSGGGTVTTGGSCFCASLNTTGFAGALTGTAALRSYGNVTIASATTLSGTIAWYFSAAGSATMVLNNKTVYSVEVSTGTLICNDLSVTGSVVTATGATLNALQINASRVVLANGSTLTNNASTLVQPKTGGSATVEFVNSGATGSISSLTLVHSSTTPCYFTTAATGITYGDILLLDNNGTTYFNSTCTCSTLKTASSPSTAHTLALKNGITVNVARFQARGVAGKLLTIRRDGTSTKPILVYTGSGIVSSDYLSLSNIEASVPNVWYAGANSVDGGGNVNWIFTAPPDVRASLFFGCNF